MPKIGPYLRNNNAPVNLRDFRHASRLYIDGGYNLMPKVSWMYYVTFELNSNVIKDIIFGGRKKSEEVGMLVKSVELPKFQINTEIMNQYNRKTIIQKNITYQPVSFSLHDDNSNRVNDLWINYFRYYYKDTKLTSNSPLEGVADNAIRGLLGANVGGFVSKLIGTSNDPAKGPYGNNKYKMQSKLFASTDYGLNADKVDKPFFKSITIYQINQHRFYSYQLVNPMIRSWEHDKLEQAQSTKTAESKMTVDYETVFYSKGSVSKDNPGGFAILHYDNTPSPLGAGSSGFKSVFKNALSGVADIFGDVLGEAAPAGGSKLLDAISAVSAVGVGGLTGIVAGNFAGQSRANTGYSTLNSSNNIPQNSLNGLGVNLNLNLGNNPSTAGLAVASPVTIAPPTIASTTPTASIPITASPSDSAAAMISSLDKTSSQVSEAKLSGVSEDTSPAGNTTAPGSYFSMPVPLTNTLPYSASSITQTSTPSEIQFELKKLNTAWANDNDFVAKQVVDPELINKKLSQSTSEAEFNSIKSAAAASIAATKNLQETVNNKYQSEFQRLTNLLTEKTTSLSGTPSLT